ncbi:GNAT family N-acetyltransferase [Propionicicella superfundia]|uniref:GNAT family N-acetyltransferase n=1 Tax=Propionicicella superfundia TaxID=348582 RepID=UPI0004281571|nr:GNAT family N-acetyltransferase [Propionicicella superfundia]
MHIAPITAAAVLRRAYDRVLVPTFPAAELGPYETLEPHWRSGRSLAWAALSDDEEVLGVAVCDRYAESSTALLTYLALAPGRRGGGVGGALYRHAVDATIQGDDVDLLVGEFEHPALHGGSESGGDPVARLRFYDRHGARGLALPYFQPGIAGQPRVPGFILGVLAVRPRLAGPDGVAGPTVHAFLTENLRVHEGAVADDPAARRLLAAAAVPDVATVALTDPDRIPLCQEA